MLSMLTKTIRTLGWIFVILISAILLAFLFFQIPPVQERIGWRLDAALTNLRGLADPAGNLPTAVPATENPLPTPSVVPSGKVTPTQRPAPTTPPEPAATPEKTLPPLPPQYSLNTPPFEFQDWNNCGPAALSIYLRHYGWEGDQNDIAEVIKPVRSDRNVNIDEMKYFVNTQAGWLKSEYRVGGSMQQLKSLIAAGIPVMVEVGFLLDENDPGLRHDDDRWTGHYLLLTGYDDTRQVFTAQNVFVGPDQPVSYRDLEENWSAFNHVLMVLFKPDQEAVVQEILGEDWNPESNRQRALLASQDETSRLPDNAFAWFNLGTNLLYYNRYSDAARAYDRARQLGLPQRMLRYQFGPFIAYFHANRIDELMTLVDYALKITPNSQEALLWQGWGLYRRNDRQGALDSFNEVLEENPTYEDARYAINFINQQ